MYTLFFCVALFHNNFACCLFFTYNVNGQNYNKHLVRKRGFYWDEFSNKVHYSRFEVQRKDIFSKEKCLQKNKLYNESRAISGYFEFINVHKF